MNTIKYQKGSSLIEALVSMVLILVVVVGTMFATQEVVKSKTQLSIHTIAINQMQSLLARHNNGIDLCVGDHVVTVPVGESGENIEVPVTVVNCNATSQVVVGGTNVTVPSKVYLTAGSDQLAVSSSLEESDDDANAAARYFSRTIGGQLVVGAP